MRHLRRLSITPVACGFAIAFVQFACAADLPVKVKAAPIVTAPSYNWTGFYVGGNLGYSWGRTDIDYAQSAGIPDGFGISGPAQPLALSSNLDLNGVIGGVQAGYDYQLGQWVLGILTDFDFRNRDANITLGPLNTFGDTLSLSTKQKWLGTVRGRVGLAFANSWLVYATGGFAYGRVSHAVTQTIITANAAIPRVFSGNDTKTGWVVGGGVDYRFNKNWSVGAEYLYVDLGTDTLAIGPSSTTGPVPPGGFPATSVSFDDRSHIVRATLNYRF